MQFDLKGQAEILALSITRTNKEDEGDVLATIKLIMEDQPAKSVVGVLGADNVAEVGHAFHIPETDDPDNNKRFLNIEAIRSRVTYLNKHDFSIAGFRVRATKVSKIELAPMAGGTWIVQANVQIQNPPGHMLEVLAELLQAATMVQLTQDPELPLEGGGKHEGKPTKASEVVTQFAKQLKDEFGDGASVELIGPDGERIASSEGAE
jgi:hypothetical protein